jgi:hypothetical protein
VFVLVSLAKKALTAKLCEWADYVKGNSNLISIVWLTALVTSGDDFLLNKNQMIRFILAVEIIRLLGHIVINANYNIVDKQAI